MILGVMQPYFLPYLEHFKLIAACDRWVVFDTVLYRRKTWMSRNRIINRETTWSYISVPIVRGATQGPVAAANVSKTNWREDLENRLRVYAREAPFYEDTCELVRGIIAPNHTTLADLNAWGLRVICDYLGISTPCERLSEMKLDLPEHAGPDEWGLLISKALGADEYRNASGGGRLLDPARFEAAGVRLSFHEHRPVSYATGSFVPVPDLSIIDPLMWCGHEVVTGWVHDRNRRNIPANS